MILNRSAQLLVFIVGGACVAVPASGSVIDSSVQTRVDDRETNGNYDELGNNAYPGQYLGVGDSSGVPATGIGELRVVIEFDISAYTAEINSAPSISFSIPFSHQNNSPQNFQLWALDADEDGDVTPDDYQAAATFVPGAEFNPDDYTSGDLVVVDVTSFVKADALAGQTWSAFRLQVADPANAPNGNGGLDGTSDLSVFILPDVNDSSTFAKLTIIPEPASLALLSAGGVVLTLRRRYA